MSEVKTVKAFSRTTPSVEKDEDVTRALNDFSINGLTLLWKIVTDPSHPWHKKYGFESLKLIVSKTTPTRKEVVSDSPKGTVELSLANLFHKNTLDDRGKTLEIEVKTNDDDSKEPDESE